MEHKPPILAPSILAADYTQLGAEIEQCNHAGIKWLHCDIMDGHFVPNISYGPTVVQAARDSTDAFLDVHLMIENPDQYIQSFVDSGADQITVHQETCKHLHRTIQTIHSHGLSAGVAVNPATSLTAIEPILNDVELVLIMSVNPGFGGQSFIPNTYERLQKMRELQQSSSYNFLIEVDGGVNPNNIRDIAHSGADVLVAGSAVFKAPDIPQRIEHLQKEAQIGKGTVV